MRTFFSTLLLSIFLSVGFAQSSNRPLAVGDAMPIFSLTDQDGKTFNVADVVGKHALIIYFYPKDESMVCTKEACSFRDSFNDFTKAGALVIGINAGTVQSHKNFAKNHQLPFILLSDPDNKVLNMFGVKGALFMTGRKTFVIDLKGKIIFTYNSMMKGSAHAEQALAAVNSIKK